MSALAGFRFHHYGLAAADVKSAIAFIERLGYMCGPEVFDPLQNVYLYWCSQKGAPAIEIVSPAGDEGPLGRILREHAASVYHLCYEIPCGMGDAVARLRQDGTRVVTVAAAKPAVLFGGRMVSFHMVRGFGLLELLEPGGTANGSPT